MKIDLERFRAISSQVRERRNAIERARVAGEAITKEQGEKERIRDKKRRITEIIESIPSLMEEAAKRGEDSAFVMQVKGVRPDFKREEGLWNVTAVKEIRFRDVTDPVALAVYKYCKEQGLDPRIAWNHGPGMTTSFPMWIHWEIHW